MDSLQLVFLPHRFLPCTAVNRPLLFTLFHSAMSGEKLRLMCLVWPDDKPDEHIVEVEVNNDRTVAALKKLIKDEYAPRLDKIAAPDLILWKCSIPADDNLQETLNSMPPIFVFIAYLPPRCLRSISRLVCLQKPSTSLLRYPRLVSVAPVSLVQC